MVIKVLLKFIECLYDGLLFVGIVELLFKFTFEESKDSLVEVSLESELDEVGDDVFEVEIVSFEGEEDAFEGGGDCKRVDVIQSDGFREVLLYEMVQVDH